MEFREIRENKEFKEYREEVIYSANTLAIFPIFPKFLKLLIFPNLPPPNFSSEVVRCGVINFHQRFTNFSSEGVRLGLSQKKSPRDSTMMYSPGRFTLVMGQE